MTAVENLTALERETVINMNDAETVARIWTAQRRLITRLRQHVNAREVRSGYEGTTEWAEFELPARDVRFTAKRTLTAEESAIRVARLLRRPTP